MSILKPVLALYDSADKDLANINPCTIKKSIQQYYAKNNHFIEPNVVGIRDLYDSSTFFPKFMLQYISIIPPIPFHYLCEGMTCIYDKLFPGKRSTPEKMCNIITNCENISEVILIRKSYYDNDFYYSNSKACIDYLSTFSKAICKYSFQVALIDRKYNVKKTINL